MNREPQPAGLALDALLGPPPSRNNLRLAMHGQNAPLQAQFVHHLVHALPRQIAQQPGSAEFRTAMRAHCAEWPVYLEPTRSDIRHGAMFLARHNQLPDWVYYSGGAL